MPITAKEMKDWLKDKPDDFKIPFDFRYGDVAHDYIFIRLDSVNIACKPKGKTMISMVLSTVSSED